MRSKFLGALFFSVCINLVSSFVYFELRADGPGVNWKDFSSSALSLSDRFSQEQIPVSVEALQMATLNPFQPDSLDEAYRSAADFLVRVRDRGGSFQEGIAAFILIQNQLEALNENAVDVRLLWPEATKADKGIKIFVERLRALGIEIPDLGLWQLLSYLHYVLFGGPLDVRLVANHEPWLKILIKTLSAKYNEYSRNAQIMGQPGSERPFAARIKEAIVALAAFEEKDRMDGGDISSIQSFLNLSSEIAQSAKSDHIATESVVSSPGASVAFNEDLAAELERAIPRPQPTIRKEKLEVPALLAANLKSLVYIGLLEGLISESRETTVERMVRTARETNQSILVTATVGQGEVRLELKLPVTSEAVDPAGKGAELRSLENSPIVLNAKLETLVSELSTLLRVVKDRAGPAKVQVADDSLAASTVNSIQNLGALLVKAMAQGLPNLDANRLMGELVRLSSPEAELIPGAGEKGRPRMRPWREYFQYAETGDEIDAFYNRSFAALFALLLYGYLVQSTELSITGTDMASLIYASSLAGGFAQCIMWICNNANSRYTGRAVVTFLALVSLIANNVFPGGHGEAALLGSPHLASYLYVPVLWMAAEMPRLVYPLYDLVQVIRYRLANKAFLKRLAKTKREIRAARATLFRALVEILNLPESAALNFPVSIAGGLKAWQVLNGTAASSGRDLISGDGLPPGCVGKLVLLASK